MSYFLQKTTTKIYFRANFKNPRKTQGPFENPRKTQGPQKKTQEPKIASKTQDLGRKPKQWQRCHSRLDLSGFWPGTETKREVFLLRTRFGIAPVISWSPWRGFCWRWEVLRDLYYITLTSQAKAYLHAQDWKLTVLLCVSGFWAIFRGQENVNLVYIIKTLMLYYYYVIILLLKANRRTIMSTK